MQAHWGKSDMTIIGKILTFLIFVFSLLFLGFAIIINNTNKDPRTKLNWYERTKQLEAAVKNSGDDLMAKEAELVSLRSQNLSLSKELVENKTRTDTIVKELTEKASILENAKNTVVTKLEQSQVVIATIQSDIEKKTKEVLELSDRLKQSEIKLADLVQKNTSEKNQRIAAQIERDTTRQRFDEAEKDLLRLQRELDDLRERRSQPQANNDNGTKPQPPPTDVQGKVVKVSDDGALVSINKGSDHGLAKNQTLEVFRFSPKAEWVARIRIIQVNEHEAVGMIVLPQNRKVTVLPGDQVGSSILPAGAGR